MENTFETIIDSMRNLALSRDVIPPEKWLAGAMKLNVLMEQEVEKLIELEFIVAQKRKELLEKGNTVAYTKTMIEATDEYREVQVQKARIKNAGDTILLAKKHATLSSELMRQNL